MTELDFCRRSALEKNTQVISRNVSPLGAKAAIGILAGVYKKVSAGDDDVCMESSPAAGVTLVALILNFLP